VSSANATAQPETPSRNPWWWVPSLYLAEGLPYILVNTVSVIIYKRLGVSNADIAMYTSLFYLPWVIKPLWGPLVDLYWTKRKWVLIMQALMGLMLMGTALALQAEAKIIWWTGTLLFFTATAFLSATHDIAADGFYMLGLNPSQQAAFVGIRSTFYRIAIIVGQGVLVMTAGVLEARTGKEPVPILVQAGPATASIAAPAPLRMDHDLIRVDPLSVALESGKTTTLTVSLIHVPETTQTLTVNQVPSVAHKYIFKYGDEFLVTAAAADGRDILEFAPGTTQPLQVVLKANERLAAPVDVKFTIGAGDIPLSWGIILGSVGAFFLLITGYHAFALPRPAEDAGTSATVPFLHAAFWLAVATVVPFTILYFFGQSLHQTLMLAITSGAEPAVREKLTKSYGEPMKFVVFAVIIVMLIAMIKAAPLRRVAAKFLYATSEKSGIGFAEVFVTFFQKPGILAMLAFLLLYRLGDAMLVKMGPPFFLDSRDVGGLGLTTTDVGLIKGTCGIMGLTIGGILGGLVLASGGLKKWLLPMALLTNLPNTLYAYMAWFQPEDITTVLLCVVTEEFFYGFGFAAYMFYMIYIAGTGERKTSHFAICTGFMALGMMLPGMLSGILQTTLGYPWFFTFVAIASLLGVIVVLFVPLDKDYGKKESEG
jgi:PAT family beta-lactamase induction signal transducer AmpG